MLSIKNAAIHLLAYTVGPNPEQAREMAKSKGTAGAVPTGDQY